MKKTALSNQFTDIYNELDTYMRKVLRMGDEVEHGRLISEMMQKSTIFERYGYELKQFARLRNAIVHNPYKQTCNPIAEPHKDIVVLYETIKNAVFNPPKALHFAVPTRSIFTATLQTNVQELMKTMIQKSYSHIPIMQGDKMLGIFSENTLLSYLVHNKESIIMQDATVAEFQDFIALEKHMSEYFEYCGRDAMLAEVEELFIKGLKAKKRIAVVFITNSGKKEEKLLGMITPWDIAGNRKK